MSDGEAEVVAADAAMESDDGVTNTEIMEETTNDEPTQDTVDNAEQAEQIEEAEAGEQNISAVVDSEPAQEETAASGETHEIATGDDDPMPQDEYSPLADQREDNDNPSVQFAADVSDNNAEKDYASGFVNVTFFINPEGYSMIKSIDLHETFAQVKLGLEQELQIPAENLSLDHLDGPVKHDGVLSDTDTFADFGLHPSDNVSVQIHIQYYQRTASATQYQMPDIIDVEIHYGSNEVKLIRVAVDKQGQEKPYLGGYRHKNTGLLFHHASTQTFKKPVNKPVRYHRDSQTYEYRTRSIQSKREAGTQMAKQGVFVDGRTDKILEPQPYFSSEEWEQMRLEKILHIQRMVRGWFARRRAHNLRYRRDDRRSRIMHEEDKRRDEATMKHKQEIERRMHPRSFQDFEILYNELEAWRVNETDRIKSSTLTTEEKKIALEQLLHKETKLLQTIDRLKIAASKHNKEDRMKSTLSEMSAPKKWTMKDGRFTEVHTPFTTRAKELYDLFTGLKMPLLSIDERLDVLLHVKWTVKEFDCNLTREIVDLIDREADMLNRGRSERSLEGLRKRLSNLFLQFIETPEFNPEAAKFQKVPRELLRPANIRPIQDYSKTAVPESSVMSN
eukprot:GILJ01002618.1.p1 GENE.GILJ01002618.1~~GILJ01002618.1.p1  ORF type:complete len:632 (+),score=127.59 GILJ01002618.1:43-1896(+)